MRSEEMKLRNINNLPEYLTISENVKLSATKV